MKWKPYPSYKDAEVNWFGEVPAHWELVPLKAAAKIALSGIDKKSKDDEDRIRFLGTDTVYSRERITPSIELEECTASADHIRSFSLQEEDIVITKDSVVPTMIAVASYVEQPPERAVCGYHLALIRSNPEKSVGIFQFYSLKSAQLASYFLSAARGTTIIGIGAGIIGRAPIPLPPLQEQIQIATFLDRETAKLDTLISNQERLIELLQEKRQAIISHAVTKGLDPDVPMKDSGVEWLGEVPAHWVVKKLGLLGVFKGGAGFPDEYQGKLDNEFPFFKVADISAADKFGVMREFNHTISSETASALRAYVFPKWTIVFAKVGAALLLQRYRTLGQPSCMDNNMMGFVAYDNKHVSFLMYVMPLLDLSLIVNPGAVPSMNEGQISSQRIPLPPDFEIERIVNYLNRETSKIDNLIKKARQSIDLAKEHRSALISAAVTGKIDVREAA